MGELRIPSRNSLESLITFLQQGHEICLGFSESSLVIIVLPVTVGTLHFRKKLLNHPHGDARCTASSKAVFGHYNFVFNEGKIEVVVYLGALRFDNICNDVNFIALNQKVRSIFTVKYEPEHQG